MDRANNSSWQGTFYIEEGNADSSSEAVDRIVSSSRNQSGEGDARLRPLRRAPRYDDLRLTAQLEAIRPAAARGTLPATAGAPLPQMSRPRPQRMIDLAGHRVELLGSTNAVTRGFAQELRSLQEYPPPIGEFRTRSDGLLDRIMHAERTGDITHDAATKLTDDLQVQRLHAENEAARPR